MGWRRAKRVFGRNNEIATAPKAAIVPTLANAGVFLCPLSSVIGGYAKLSCVIGGYAQLSAVIKRYRALSAVMHYCSQYNVAVLQYQLITTKMKKMFISSSTKGAVAYNVLILMAIVIISVIIALSFLTFKPKGTTGDLKPSLDLGKKAANKTATPAAGTQTAV